MPFCELDLEQNKNEITTILINEVMRKKQVKKSYSAPECTIIQVNEATYLMDTSFPGQHKPAIMQQVQQLQEVQNLLQHGKEKKLAVMKRILLGKTK